MIGVHHPHDECADECAEQVGDDDGDEHRPREEAEDRLGEGHRRVDAHAAEDPQDDGDAEGPGRDREDVAGAAVLRLDEDFVAVDADAEEDHEAGSEEFEEESLPVHGVCLFSLCCAGRMGGVGVT